MTSQGVFYQRLDEPEPGGLAPAPARYRATEHTAGPWDPRHQHGGPPTALLARAVQRLAAGPSRGLLARISAEILAPVPVADVLVQARVERPGRKVAWCSATLSAATAPEVPLVRLHAWVLRRREEAVSLPPGAVASALPPGPGQVRPRPDGSIPGYLDAVEWAWVAGGFQQPGPATVWAQLKVGVVEAEVPDGVQRMVAVADSGSGISSVADPRRLRFVNTDLTVHLHREPIGEAVSMSSVSTLDPLGVGMAVTRLGDAQGAVGVGAQTLFVEPVA